MHSSSDGNQISTQDKITIVERIVTSRTFNKSERLSSFLLHVCEMDIQGRGSEISEQQIGHAVFGRSKDYDASIDGIVRSHASRLRLRLEQYYAREGKEEHIRLRIPRGRYIPFFERLSTPEDETKHPESSEESPAIDLSKAEFIKLTDLQEVSEDTHSPSYIRSRRWTYLPWLLAWVVAAISLGLILQYRDLASVRNLILTTRHPFWNQFFAPGQKTVIVAGDSSLAVWQELMKRNLGLADYLSANYRSNTTSQPTTKEQEAAYLATRRYTSIVDLEIIQSFSHIEQARQYSPDIRYARDLRPNDFKQNNIVLIGTAETNPWVQLFEREMNFVFSKDRMAQTYSIINRKPSMNEPSAWVYKETDEQHRVYGLVAYQPNIGTSKNVLILEGTAMAGTECARDFITDERQLIPFLKKIERKDGTIPHFEVVLGTNNINGSAVKSSILAWRTSP